jgi:UDP-N-acetylmuramyl pentapeptide phosphotransferase/UDP-N-acetylglucosamine-1-phosphate transferase
LETIQPLLILISFFVIEYIYIKIAEKYNIIDLPNERSSHTELTIRGGGIIFVFAAVLAVALQPAYWMPVLGLLIIGVISFIDDRVNLSSKLRVLFHLIAATLLFTALGLFVSFPWYVVVAFYFIVIGVINAYNFMDGINGITGAYSLVVLSALQYVNYNVEAFIPANLIWIPILATLVFLFFNFRKKAKCFAGDVGSVTIAFWIIFLIAYLILKTGDFSYVLFLVVYGVDTSITIVHRIMLKQNIFEAHRLHLYQLLANEEKWPQLVVSSMYALVQLGVIVVVVLLPWSFINLMLLILIPLITIYLVIRYRLFIKKR